MKCDQCKREYNRYSPECPECKNPNPDYEKNIGQKTFLPIKYQIIFALLGSVFFTLLAGVIQLICYAKFGSEPSHSQEITILAISTFVTDGIIFLIFLLFIIKFRKDILRSFKVWKNYIGMAIVFGLLFGLSLLGQFLLQHFCGLHDGENERLLNDVIATYPALSIIFIGFLAPICEEMTYRVGLFSLLHRYKKWVAYVVTIVIFTLIHIHFTAEDLPNELLNIPLYLLGAIALTFAYDKFGLAGSICCHILNNTILVIMRIAS